MSNDNKQYEHQPVMLEEVLEMWSTRADGFYVDGTFGRGGHSRALLGRLDDAARLVQQALGRDMPCHLSILPLRPSKSRVRAPSHPPAAKIDYTNASGKIEQGSPTL